MNTIVEQGRYNYKQTEEYTKSVYTIEQNIRAEFDQLLILEPNFFKKTILKLKMHVRIRKEIQELTSEKKLFLFQEYPH